MVFFATGFEVQLIAHKKPVPMEAPKQMIDIESQVPGRADQGRISRTFSLKQLLGRQGVLRLGKGGSYKRNQQKGY